MKNTVKISQVYFSTPIEGDYGTYCIANINTIERIKQFKVNEDGEKEEVEARQLSIRDNEFDRLLVVNDFLAALPLEQVSDEDQAVMQRNQILDIRYKHHIELLRGATLEIEREEVYENVVDDEGNEVKDAEGKVQTKLVGFGEMTIKSLKLNIICQKKVEKMLDI